MAFGVSWVLRQQLCLGPAPRNLDDLQTLKSEGVISVLSVCVESDFRPLPQLADWFEWRWFPLPDHRSGRPPEPAELSSCLELLAELMAKPPVYVHCLAGMERSPLLVLVWLMQHRRLNLQQALDYLQQVHPGTNPLPEQLAVLKHFSMPELHG